MPCFPAIYYSFAAPTLAGVVALMLEANGNLTWRDVQGVIASTAQYNDPEEPSWMTNESSFKSIPLKYVLAEFERQYNMVVKTQNIDVEQLFTGTFSNTDINLALESISTPSQIRYTLGDDNVLFYAENTP